MFRRGIGFFDEFDGPSISSITSSIANTINKDNLQRAWEISTNAVSAIAETGERALRGTQSNSSWTPPNVPAGGIGRDIASFGRPREQSGGFGYQGPPMLGSTLPSTHVKEKKKSHKPRGHRSEGDEEFEAARRRTQKKGHKKKSNAFYSESSGEPSDAEERRRQEAEEKAQRKREKERERELEREKERDRLERERERLEREREAERERRHEADLELDRQRTRDLGSDTKHRSKEKEHKEKKKKKKDKDKDKDKDRHRGEREREKERPVRHGRSDSESADSEEKVPSKAVLREQDFGQGYDSQRAPGQGEEELDRLFGFAVVKPEHRRTLLDELFTPIAEEPPPPPKVSSVVCPSCGCLFYPSEITKPPPDAALSASMSTPPATAVGAAATSTPSEETPHLESHVTPAEPTTKADSMPAMEQPPAAGAALLPSPGQAGEATDASPSPAEDLPDVDGEAPAVGAHGQDEKSPQ